MTINKEFFNQDTENIYSTDETISKLIQAITLEEEALARLLNIESDKVLAFIGKNLDFPTDPSSSEIIRFNKTVIQLLDTMLMAEWLLLKKLDAVAFMRHDQMLGNSED